MKTALQTLNEYPFTGEAGIRMLRDLLIEAFEEIERLEDQIKEHIDRGDHGAKT